MASIAVLMPVVFRGSWEVPNCHSTLLWLGREGEVFLNRKVVEEAVARLRSQCKPEMVPVTGLEVFGKGHVTALTLATRTLQSYRTFLEKELRRDGIVSPSEYAYRPHVSLTTHEYSATPVHPKSFAIPSMVWVDRPVLSWGSEGILQ